LAYSIAGFRQLLAVDWEPNAIATLQRNFPGVATWEGDIAHLPASEIFSITGMRRGELDVLDGSPPCQGSARPASVSSTIRAMGYFASMSAYSTIFSRARS
jgi:DNA (cytosine-5)-methyltransferase 1